MYGIFADYRNFSVFQGGQRQCLSVVFQQYHAFPGKAYGLFMLPLPVIMSVIAAIIPISTAIPVAFAVVRSVTIAFPPSYHMFHGSVQLFPGQCLIFQSGPDFLIQSGPVGHYQIHTRPDSSHRMMHRAPV